MNQTIQVHRPRFFLAHLAKDWRDQRSTLLTLGLLFAVSFAALAAFGGPLTRSPLAELGATVCAFTALFVVGVDIVAGERRRKKLCFLARLPGGLAAAFRAKLTFFFATLGAFALFGYGLGALVLELNGVSGGDYWGSWSLWHSSIIPFGFVFLLWVFAAACWSPRGLLALPLGALAAVLSVWPIWLVWPEKSFFPWTDREAYLLIAFTFVAALLVAWAAFVPGLANGGRARRALCFALGAAALVLSPTWAKTATRWHRARFADPYRTDFVIRSARIAHGGEYALLTTRGTSNPTHEDADHCLLVHLPSGEWSQLDEEAASLWMENEIHDPAYEPLPGVPNDAHRYRAGCGLWIGSIRNKIFYDPSRQRVFDLDELIPSSVDIGSVFVRSGHWMVGDYRSERWLEFDPDTGRLAESPHLAWTNDTVSGTVADGRLIVVRDGSVYLHTPESGQFDPVAIPGWSGTIDEVMPARDSAAEGLLYISGPGLGVATAHFAPDTERLELLPMGDLRLLRGEANRRYIALEKGQRIVRGRFGTDEREVLFPRPTTPGS